MGTRRFRTKRIEMSKEIQNRLRWLIQQLNDDRLDGFNQFEAKQELYEIKRMVDKALDSAPTFTSEKDWIRRPH